MVSFISEFFFIPILSSFNFGAQFEPISVENGNPPEAGIGIFDFDSNSKTMEAKRARTSMEGTTAHVPVSLWNANIPTPCELRSNGLQDKAEALSTAKRSWFADMAKWREHAFEHIETKQTRVHMHQKQKEFRRQMLQHTTTLK
ncbi:Aste57867_11000 [Aphanomyces stellatus]|uniref:Aste57867_11000 protein n=1 Tax=Aphanomyces stellatus TaxID=120398 RepID=A0A485KRX2_9STRA|nr:hypothetical protein As57867_010959 [Aphanomyces stellatus]VFT87868.1 Aste57867_11000 [Aphanomyces stellatus]